MLMYAVRRVLVLVPLLIVVSLVVFALVHMIPGDPAITISGENATAAQIEATRERLGLNDPILQQYFRWATDAVQGDFGQSLFSSRSVTGAIFERFPVTISVTLAAMVIALLIAIPAGTIAAIKRGKVADRLATLFASIGIAVPNFWLGIVLIIVFSLQFSIFPAVGYTRMEEGVFSWARGLVLPGLTLGMAAAAETTRQLRSSLYDVLHQDYIRTARAKGMGSLRTVGKHAMKNAAVPVVTVIGFQLAFLLGGSVVVERVFGLPGLGSLAIRAVLERDIPMIQGIVIITALIVMVINLLVDLSYAYLDPRVRRS